MTVSNSTEITAIAGGGWAGLATAVKLSAHGQKVLLLEASGQLGGRARSVPVNNKRLDNGQHILLGAYRGFLDMLEILGLMESDIVYRKKLDLCIHSLHGSGIKICAAALPGPFHLFVGVITARGLNITDKTGIIRFWLHLLKTGFTLESDMCVADYLGKHRQSKRVTNTFWGPLCIAALNTTPAMASARIFLNVLRKSFTGSRHNSDMLLPRVGLGDMLPAPASRYIRQRGGQVNTNERVLEIIMDGEILSGIKTSCQDYSVSNLVLATPCRQTGKLLMPLPGLKDITERLGQLKQEAIITLYMQFPETIRIENDMAGIYDGLTQWLIDRRTCGQPGLIAAVISTNGPHLDMNRDELEKTIISETRQLFPEWPEPESTFLLREKQATFSCTCGSDRLRPRCESIGNGIWLAGDYIDTGLPSTLESAIQSGLQCADRILQKSVGNQTIRG